MSDRVNLEVLSWEQLIKRVYGSKLEGRKFRGSPCARRLDGVKKACYPNSLKIRNAKSMFMDRKP